jgi:hypothetical protein
MEKVTILPLVLGHLTRMDFIAAFIGWFLRCLFTWSDARHKVVVKAGQQFSNGRYLAENWDRLLVSNLCSLGLLVMLPELIILILTAILGHPVNWMSAFSGIIGLLGTDIVNSIMRGGKRRLTRLIGGEEALPTPGYGALAEEPETGPATDPEPQGRVPGRPLLPLLLLALALLGSCTTARERALNQAQRHARKVAAILAQYPDLADSLTTVQRDTLHSSANQDSARWAQAQDTTAFGQLLDEYVRQRASPPCPPTSTVSAGGGPATAAVGSGSAYKIPAKETGRNVPLPAISQAAYLARLRQQLQRGAGLDTTYRYQDAYLSTEITVKNGVLSFKYQLKPQKLAYDKHLTTLRPASALPEECVPKHFWHDWLFWLLLVLTVLLFGFRARLKQFVPWVP